MKIIKFLFSGTLMGMLLVVFAVGIGYATFIENDYDATTARLLVYNARWFEVLMLLMIVNFAGMIFTKRLYRKSKLNILVIHLALIIIIVGAAITRYFGFEGVMHIRNGQTANTFLTADNYILINLISGDEQKHVEEPLLVSAYKEGLFKKNILVNHNNVNVTLSHYYPNATKRLVPDTQGDAYLQVIVGGAGGRYDVLLKEGERESLNGFGISFGNTENENDVKIFRKNDSLFVEMPFEMVRNEHDSTVTLSKGTPEPIGLMELQSYRNVQFVIKDFQEHGTIAYEPVPENEGLSSAVLEFVVNGKRVFGEWGQTVSTLVDDVKVDLYVGQKQLTLPFSLKLNEFKLERYPGSNSPSSFTSDILLIDERAGLQQPYAIFMNNVLEYQGYRFYQSSYDQDEKGTVLSVNHDYWGTRVTYFGYFLLFVTMAISFFTRNTRFRRTLDFIRETHEKRKNLVTPVLLLFFMFSGLNDAGAQPVDKQHADDFGSLLVQGQDGRMMPINTLASQLMIKIHKKSTYEGLSAEQVLLGMMINPDQWEQKPFVRVNHPEIQKLLGIEGRLASYVDFFNAHGQYKLGAAAKVTYSKRPALRNQYDKELIKVSERINIFHNLLQGSMLNILPLPNDPLHTWTSPVIFSEMAVDNPEIAGQVFEQYIADLRSAVATDDYSKADESLAKLSNYQQSEGAGIIPSKQKVKVEVFYNKANVFKRLFPIYLTFGILLVVLFFLQILKPSLGFDKLSKFFFVILIVAFAAQTIGLILRWYISGHAPWSNGYESMIYISWATMLAGFLFMKKSPITLGLTATLAGITLLTAHMSWMDPEITNLVPVLKSYWLTIHVAAITASYGFLGLAALMGFFNLCLMPFRNEQNLKRLNLMLKELTLIIELSLMSGLALLIIGNFLGAIWANESWGRYWGWDPKETWTLVTVIVYSFILHMSLIPGLKTAFMINFMSLISFSTVLMTYFGVNFYLSGLHSYAGGDPVPIPDFVYYTIIIIAIVSVLASYNEFTMKGFDVEPEEVS